MYPQPAVLLKQCFATCCCTDVVQPHNFCLRMDREGSQGAPLVCIIDLGEQW